MSVAMKRLHLFSVDDVQRMVEAGVLDETDKVELLHGVLVTMSPQGPIHSSLIALLADRLRANLPADSHVREEKPLQASRHDLPEPDIAVVRGEPRAWMEAHPTGRDALLVVEVAWSSQDVDLEKAAVYSRGGVPEYWLLDLPARQLRVFRGPDGQDGWTEALTLVDDAEVTPGYGGPALRVSGLLP